MYKNFKLLFIFRRCCVLIENLKNKWINKIIQPHRASALKFNILLPFILNKLGLEATALNDKLIVVFSNIFIICLMLLFSFLNIIKDLYILYLLNKYKDLEILTEKLIIFKKYPKCKFILNWMVRRYKKLSLIYIILEILLCLFMILFLLIFSYYVIHDLYNIKIT